MMPKLETWSLKRIARVAGALSIGSGVPDGFSVSTISRVIVPNDPAATAANILGSLLTGGPGAAALTTAQAQAMAFVMLKMHAFAYVIALVFTGFGCLCLAYLATRATFIPRVSGWFLAIDGLGYLTSSFSSLVYPPLAVALRPVVPFVTGILGTGALMIWLIVNGVNVPRWEEQNGGAFQ
jgi:Domain of unknown function (DUF4386)